MSQRPLTSLRRALARAILAGAALATTLPAVAQAVYTYSGNPFTLFSCGPSSGGMGTALCSTPAPLNPNTSYTATDRVTATLTVASPLPPNLPLGDVRSYAGFRLTMSDVRHAVDDTMAVGMAAEVATDASGRIAQWRLIINTGGLDNGGIASQNAAFISDSGTLRCCDPTVAGDLARNANLPGTWTSGPPAPAALLVSLRNLVASPELMLTAGQVASLSDKLNNALASVQAGLNKQAINQLNAFIGAVDTARKTGKMGSATAATLVAAARAIILLL